MSPARKFAEFLIGFFGVYVYTYILLLIVGRLFSYSTKALVVCGLLVGGFIALALVFSYKKHKWAFAGVLSALVIVILAAILALAFIYLYSKIPIQ
jgi:hypothetical protein